MYNKNKLLALIPARGGSKGIKNKNIITLNGFPLISYSIKASLGSRYIDDTVVTTDSDEIASIAKRYGASVPFMRPSMLASDRAKTIDAVLHSIKMFEKMGKYFDILVLLQPTQPLRTAEDIDKAIEMFFEKNKKGLVSVCPVEEHPILIRSIDENSNLTALLKKNSTCRRQDMEDYYRVNGCIYINQIAGLSKETSFNDNPVGFIMDRSHSVDIDEMKDLYIAEYYMRRDKSN